MKPAILAPLWREVSSKFPNVLPTGVLHYYVFDRAGRIRRYLTAQFTRGTAWSTISEHCAKAAKPLFARVITIYRARLRSHPTSMIYESIINAST